MARFSDQTIERVRDAVDFVEVVSVHTDLRRAGERFSGLCPFHEERTPSFSVDPRDKLYYCFGCEASGDLFTFVEEKEGLPFPEAVESLAERYGVEIERETEDPRVEEARKRRARLGEVLDRTSAFYTSYLWESPKAAKAREYLAGRGLGEEVLRTFAVGLAPGQWGQVLERGQRAGYAIEEMQAAGLIRKGQKGGYYDWFRSRIIFPVRDARGRMLGFGARGLTPDAKPKYLNSPESEIYRKSRILFGVDRARMAMAKGGRALVVEGYTDVLALHQAGFEEAVAVMGTAITPDQLTALAGLCEEVVLALDADRAGRAAMLRAQNVAGSRKLRLRVAQMPSGEDPADMLTGEGAGEGAVARFREIADGALDMPVFHVRSILDAGELESPSGRDQALDELLPVLAGMGETISRDELTREVAERLNVEPSLVTRRLAGEGRPRPAEAATRRPAPAADGAAVAPPRRPVELSGRERREQALLAMCIASPRVGRDYLAKMSDDHLSGPLASRARDWIAGHLEDPVAGMPRDDEELVSLVTKLVAMSRREPSTPEAMEINFLELERRAVEEQLRAARQSGADTIVDLQRRRADLAERIARDRG
ncbi:MAG: DNA primase [Solirubrobacterales bacterium]